MYTGPVPGETNEACFEAMEKFGYSLAMSQLTDRKLIRCYICHKGTKFTIDITNEGAESFAAGLIRLAAQNKKLLSEE